MGARAATSNIRGEKGANLGYNELGVFFCVQVKLGADVLQGNSGVGETHHSDACLDNVVPQPQDQSVRLVFLKLGAVFLHGTEEGRQVADADGLRDVQVRDQGLAKHWLAKDRSLWDLSQQKLDNNQEF